MHNKASLSLNWNLLECIIFVLVRVDKLNEAITFSSPFDLKRNGKKTKLQKLASQNNCNPTLFIHVARSFARILISAPFTRLKI